MPHVLSINGGSSSIRFAVFDAGAVRAPLLRGKLDRLGDAPSLTITRGGDARPTVVDAKFADGKAPVDGLMDWLEHEPSFAALGAIGHRVVHGMLHSAPERVTPRLLSELRDIVPFDPEHLPREIELIEALQRRYAGMPQVACFDTAFHRSMPPVATQLPIPRRFAQNGVQRYGFHGLSYTFLMEELARLRDPAATHGRVILAHLGGGASIAAVLNGRSVDTSMGFTPTSGLVMGTRSGDLDPGLMTYLALVEGMNADRFRAMTNHESGLLGISQTSADVRDLLARESRDVRAAQALDLFCYQAKKWIGAFAAVLGGIDTLVFAGGIGENAAPVRKRVCEGMRFLGIDIDDTLNDRHAPCISRETASVSVRVIRTDEESVIATSTIRLLGLAPVQELP